MGNSFVKQELEISVVGLSESGKSSFIDALRSLQFDENKRSTVGFDMHVIHSNKYKMKMWDLGGQQRFRGMWSRYCRQNDAIIFVIDSCNKDSLLEIRTEFEELFIKHNNSLFLKGIPILIVFTKSDLENAMTKHELIASLDLLSFKQTIFKDRKVGCIQISSKTNHNITKVIDWIEKCKKPYFDFDRKTLCAGYCRLIEEKYRLQLPTEVCEICTKYYGIDILFD